MTRTHLMTGSRAHRIWKNMLTRCTNRKWADWPRYGGRGITVDPRWHKFENFFADMGFPPKDLTLDRIGNNGGYSKSNCRWVTRAVQAQNRRSAKLDKARVIEIRLLLASGRSLASIARNSGVHERTIARIRDNLIWRQTMEA